MDPQFVDAGAGNFRPQASSPCIDAAVECSPLTDIQGTLRPQGAAWDIGTYEFVDADRDGMCDTADVASDPDRNGIPTDIEGTGDVDGDEIPNCYDVDSDGDGYEDSEEGVGDLDSDGVPNFLDQDGDGDGQADQRPAPVFYVNVNNATGSEDGLTWATAFKTIQPAINAAYQAGGGEVWVAQGVYNEARYCITTFQAWWENGENTREDGNTGSLNLYDGVQLFGGFQGTEQTRDERDWTAHPTRIDGSVARDGAPAYHVLIAGLGTTLDGFEITGGRADFVCSTTAEPDGFCRVGGGMFVPRGPCRIGQCTFRDNLAACGGALALFTQQFVAVEECTFEGNRTERIAPGISGGAGGAIFVLWPETHDHFPWPYTYLTIRDCVFTGNQGFDGGAVYLCEVDMAQIVNCLFCDNLAQGNGGAIYDAWPGRRDYLINCGFRGNYAPRRGGAVYLTGLGEWADYAGGWIAYWPAYMTVANSTFSQNTAAEAGGIACDVFGHLDAANSVLWDNTGELTAFVGEGHDEPGEITVAYSDVEEGWPGVGNINLDPAVTWTTEGCELAPDSPAIDAGASEGAPPMDLYGRPRPRGVGVDMGAHEFGTAQWQEDGQPVLKYFCIPTERYHYGTLGVYVADPVTVSDLNVTLDLSLAVPRTGISLYLEAPDLTRCKLFGPLDYADVNIEGVPSVVEGG